MTDVYVIIIRGFVFSFNRQTVIKAVNTLSENNVLALLSSIKGSWRNHGNLSKEFTQGKFGYTYKAIYLCKSVISPEKSSGKLTRC